MTNTNENTQLVVEVANDLELSNIMTSETLAVVKDEKGKFKRQLVGYSAFSSIVPETQEQKIAMFNLFQSEEQAVPMKDAIGSKILVTDVIMKPYESVDEDTGEIKGGVVTYIFDKDGHVYVTSSKTVYFTLKQLFGAFGLPHYSEGEELTLEIFKKKGTNGDIINVKLLA